MAGVGYGVELVTVGVDLISDQTVGGAKLFEVPLSLPARTIIAPGPITVLPEDYFIFVAQSAPAAISVLLPESVNKIGGLVVVDANGVAENYPISIVPMTGELINGIALIALNTPFEALQIQPLPTGGWVTLSALPQSSQAGSVSGRQMRLALIDQGNIGTVINAIPASASDPVNADWTVGAIVYPGDALAQAIQTALNYSDDQMAALFTLAQTYPY